MNIRQITIFLTVLRTRSATSAAAVCGVSQPAVSQTIKQMEAELGLKLFVRLNGRLTPTLEAERVANEMSEIVASYDRMRGTVDSMRDDGNGLLRIATLTYAHVFLPQTIRQLQEVAPKARIAIQVLPTTGIVDLVLQGRADIGIVTSSADPQLTRFHDMKGLPVIAAVPRDSDLAHLPVITPGDLRDRRILSYDPQSPFGELASRAFASVGERFEVSLHVASSTLLCALVEQGAGIALLEPFILLGPSRFDVDIKPFQPAILMKPRILSSGTRPRSLLAQKFQEILEAHANRLIKEAGFPVATTGREI